MVIVTIVVHGCTQRFFQLNKQRLVAGAVTLIIRLFHPGLVKRLTMTLLKIIEGVTQFLRLKGVYTHTSERLSPHCQGRVVGLVNNKVCPGLPQLVVVLAIKGTGQYAKVSMTVFQVLNQGHCLFTFVDGHNEQAGLVHARRMKQVRARRIAIEALDFDLSHVLHLPGLAIKTTV